MNKFLNPKNDLAFKRIFGTEKNKDILIHFLNDILMRPAPIVSVSFLKTTGEPEIASLRASLVDVLCEDQNGDKFVIEMQIAHEKSFEKRALYYAAKTYCSQRNRKTEYQHLKTVYFLAITAFTPFPKKTSWFSQIGLTDLETHEHDIKSLQLFFLQLPLFTKTKADLEGMTIREKWAYFFKYAEETEPADLDKLIGDDVIIKRAYDELSSFGWSEAELYDYESADMKQWSNKAVLESALERGLEQGMERGMEKGMERGMEKGIAQGIEQGRKEERLELVRRLLKRNRPIEEIIEDTGLTPEEIDQLKRRQK